MAARRLKEYKAVDIINEEVVTLIYIKYFGVEKNCYEETQVNFIGLVGCKTTQAVIPLKNPRSIFYGQSPEDIIISKVSWNIISRVFYVYFVEFIVDLYVKCKRRSISKFHYHFLGIKCFQSIELRNRGEMSFASSFLVRALECGATKLPVMSLVYREILSKSSTLVQSVTDIKVTKKGIVNLSIETRRHNTADSILTVKLKTLIQCSNVRLLNGLLCKKSEAMHYIFNKPLAQVVDNRQSSKTTVKDIFNRFQNSKASEILVINNEMKILDVKASVLQKSLSCEFPFRFICFLLLSEFVLLSLLERKDKLKVFYDNHSRIILNLNDTILDEQDRRRSKLIVESNSNVNLIRTLDLININFPYWSLWRNGKLD